LDLVAPPRCPACQLKLLDDCYCPTCGFPDKCIVCRQLREDSDGVYLLLAGGFFAGGLREIVHAFKYQSDQAALGILANQTALALPDGLCWDGLVPVPAHPVRVRERGMALTTALANALSNLTGIPVISPLRRQQYTKTLTGHGREARRRILEEAVVSSKVSGSLLLVDDVATTGATFGVCRRALLSAGARSADLLVAARTPESYTSYR